MSRIGRIKDYIRKHGAAYTVRRAGEMLGERFLHSWDRQYRRERPSEAELASQRSNQPDAGLISVIVPVYNTRPVFLRELCESLQAQTYAHWEAVLYDGCSTDAATIAALDGIRDERIRVIHDNVNEGISGNTNRAAAQSRGRYIALCDHDDVLTPDALWRMADAIVRTGADLLYSDEDKLSEDGRLHVSPYRKPDFCPDNLRSGNYVCHLTVISRALFDQVGGLRGEFDGSQDHDLVLRASESASGICHVPHVLYHWRNVGTSVSHLHLDRCLNAASRAVTDHMQRIGYPGQCRVENGVLRLEYDVDPDAAVEVINLPADAACSDMNRLAAQSKGEYLLFVREEIQGVDAAFIREMLMHAQRSDVASVSPLLCDKRGRVAHAGFALRTDAGLICRNHGLPAHAGGWHGMNRTVRNVSAVSGACMMVRRSTLMNHPLDGAYTGGYGVADWCLRMQDAGMVHVCTPHAKAVCPKCEWLAPTFDKALFTSRWAGRHDPCIGKDDNCT